ncbi:ATP-binding cassette domain-containing protein [Azospirillum sp. YIM B02556]|uniref:ATP-binding cassette domain-containing protein n=1 Tax=Azospirillum endophyticum TaxID=2800326 RepID=A0ABS1FGA1_9PROT|nr:ATP-binding cassette domain-containing protein [Azospirillum endophyticum]MBK1842358.1 ATP-binding cassette domain-containing protein [Azospirillum endophyticum]
MTSPVVPSTDPMFRIDGVSFALPGRLLLDLPSCDLFPHRVTALIGHNGSGKSTLLKILARQQHPSGGRVLFEGQPLERWKQRTLARRIGYLPQHMPPASGLLVRELVALGRYPWHGALGAFRAEDARKVEEALVLTDTARFAGRLVDSLSGGERQRVWLAMLIAQDAGCLLLDEPISALDVAHQVEVLALVRRLSRERGIGVIAVLHDVNMAARFCDDIVALHGGRLIDRGTPAEIMTPARLGAIYGLPMAVIPHPDSGEPVGLVR